MRVLMRATVMTVCCAKGADRGEPSAIRQDVRHGPLMMTQLDQPSVVLPFVREIPAVGGKARHKGGVIARHQEAVAL